MGQRHPNRTGITGAVAEFRISQVFDSIPLCEFHNSTQEHGDCGMFRSARLRCPGPDVKATEGPRETGTGRN